MRRTEAERRLKFQLNRFVAFPNRSVVRLSPAMDFETVGNSWVVPPCAHSCFGMLSKTAMDFETVGSSWVIPTCSHSCIGMLAKTAMIFETAGNSWVVPTCTHSWFSLLPKNYDGFLK